MMKHRIVAICVAVMALSFIKSSVLAQEVFRPLRTDAPPRIDGVLDDPVYECPTQTEAFSDGDRIVLYTDGVIEAHDQQFEMLGIERVQEVLRDKTGRGSREFVSEELLREVQRFRSGPAEDDVLIVELTRN